MRMKRLRFLWLRYLLFIYLSFQKFISKTEPVFSNLFIDLQNVNYPEEGKQQPIHSFKSFSVAGLILLLHLLCDLPWFKEKNCDISSIDSSKIQEYLQAGNPHPATLFPYCFSFCAPVAAITYEWSLNMKDILSFINIAQIIKCSKRYGMMVPLDMSSLYIWIDVFFVDQQSKDVIAALELSDGVYSNAHFHLALGTKTLLTRAWCLSEYAVRFGAGGKTLVLESSKVDERFDLASFLKQTDAEFYENMQAKFDDDKAKIRGKIDRAFWDRVHFNTVIKGIVQSGVDQVCFDLMHWDVLCFYGEEHNHQNFLAEETIMWMPVCGSVNTCYAEAEQRCTLGGVDVQRTENRIHVQT